MPENPFPEPPIQENPQLRLFLERASEVVAQCGGLNARSRVLLGKLADELGIGRDEAEPAIHTLLIATEDFTPKGSNGRGSARGSDPAGRSADSADRGAASKPPPIPKPSPGENDQPPGVPPPPVVIDDDAVVQNFIDKAAYVLAQHGGWNPKSRVILSQLADMMGVTPREMETALATLLDASRGVEVVTGLTDEAPVPLGLSSWESALGDEPLAPPLAGAASPSIPPPPDPLPGSTVPPPPPKPKPEEQFRTYLHKAMDDLRRPKINPRREQRLIEQGVHKLGLSPVFARHLVCDVARERNVTVESLATGDAPQPHDERAAEFLRRARAIIAEQRGVTVPGQIKIAAAAQELGLSDEDRQQAMASLQEGAAPATVGELRRQERLAAFRESLDQRIAALPRKIITPDLVADLVENGCEFFGVEAAEAEQAVRESAAKGGVRYLSQQRAVEHLTRLVSEKMAGSPVLREADRKRILAEGAQWGVGAQDVDAIIGEQVEINRQAQAARRRRAGVLIALAGAAAVTLVCVLAGRTLLRGTTANINVAVESEEGASSGDGAKSGDKRPAPPPDAWWDVELSVAMTRAEIELHYLRPALAPVRSHSSDARAQGYEDLLDGLPRVIESRTATAVTQEIVAGCYALDPSDAAAGRLRKRLLEYLPDAEEPLARDARTVPRAYVAAQMAAAAATRQGGSSERREAMQRALAHALGFAVDPAWDKTQFRRECLAALTRMYYRSLTAAASSQPQAVRMPYEFVSAEAERVLDVASLERLDAEFLQALLSSDEDVWRQYQEPILRVVGSEDPTVVLEAVEIMERTSNQSLQYYLVTGLLRRIGEASQGQSPAEVAAAVRREFGVRPAPAEAAEVGWRKFVQEAEQRLAALTADGSQPTAALEETAHLVRLATLGCLLSQGDLSRSALEELAEREPLSLSQGSSDSSESADMANAATSARARLVTRYVDSLSRSSHPVQRTGYLRGIVENASEVREIDPPEAEVIAKYLLSPMPDEERKAIAEFIPVVGRWRMVRLALADLIPDTPVRPDLVQEVVAAVLGREAGALADSGEDWRLRLREELMRSVLQGGFLAPSTHPYDQAQNAILEMYKTQAKALGVSPAAYANAASPTAVLPPMIEQLAARLSGKTRRDEDVAFLSCVPHELAAAEYLGDTDLHRLALLERIWLRLLAMEITHLHSDRADKAQAIVDALGQSDRQATNTLLQLRDGQAALVRLWLLYAA